MRPARFEIALVEVIGETVKIVKSDGEARQFSFDALSSLTALLLTLEHKTQEMRWYLPNAIKSYSSGQPE